MGDWVHVYFLYRNGAVSWPISWSVLKISSDNNFSILSVILKFAQDTSPFHRATDTPVLNFWRHLPWVSKPALTYSATMARLHFVLCEKFLCHEVCQIGQAYIAHLWFHRRTVKYGKSVSGELLFDFSGLWRYLKHPKN